MLIFLSPHAISHDDEIFTCEIQTSFQYFRQNVKTKVLTLYTTLKLIKLDEQTFVKQSEMFQLFKGS